MPGQPPSRAIIDLNAYVHNLAQIRKAIPNECRILTTLKTDAYGHGASQLAKRAEQEGAAMIGVATIDEGLALRETGITIPILVLIEVDHASIPDAIEHDLRLTISDTAIAEKIGDHARKANKVVPIHCKIDTGMGRQGFDLDTAPEQLLFLTRISHIDIEGIATHFPNADQPDDPTTADQIKNFRQLLRAVSREGIPFEMAHAANSAAIINFPAAAFDLVRPGLITYGVWPMVERPADCPFRPVLRWESRVRLIRTLKAGASIGYGRTFTANSTIRVALLPVGYGDGYMHALGNRAEVLIRGRRCPVRGAVSMDQILVDVSKLPGVDVGETAVLIGADGGDAITAEELAQHADTIPYEILTRIGPRVEREYIE